MDNTDSRATTLPIDRSAADPIATQTSPSGPLSASEVAAFVRHGYHVGRRLVPPDIVASVRDRMWRELGRSPDDPSTWPEAAIIVPHEVNRHMAPCRTAQVEAVAEQLVGAHFRRGGGASPVINFPRHGEPVFEPMGLHIDGIDVTTLLPLHRFLVTMTYLTDTVEFGGATAVSPGSHRLLFEHWITSGTVPGGKTAVPDLDYQTPIPVTANAGDVVFLHYLVAHGSSHNRANHPRVALNGVVGPDRDAPYVPKLGPPAPDWTPIDWTLRTDTLGIERIDQLPRDTITL